MSRIFHFRSSDDENGVYEDALPISIHLRNVKQSWAVLRRSYQKMCVPSPSPYKHVFQRTDFAKVARIARPKLSASRKGAVGATRQNGYGPRAENTLDLLDASGLFLRIQCRPRRAARAGVHRALHRWQIMPCGCEFTHGHTDSSLYAHDETVRTPPDMNECEVPWIRSCSSMRASSQRALTKATASRKQSGLCS